MTWGADNGRAHRERSASLTAAYEGPAGMPFMRANSGAELLRRVAEGSGSRGGAPIWVMEEAYVPEDIARNRSKEGGRWLRRDGRPRRTTPIGIDRAPNAEAQDPDGFAVYGRYPKGFLRHVLRTRLLGAVERGEILHVCSGTLGPDEAWTVDLRPEARPRVVASGTALPFRDGCFKAVMLDPPYSDQYARNLYGTENPRPSWLLREAARVVMPGGRIGMLHVAVPFAPPDCRLVKVYGVSTGVGFRIRAFTVFERAQDSLLDDPPTGGTGGRG